MRQGKTLRRMVDKILDCIICDKSRLDKKTVKIYDNKESFEIYIPRDLRIIFHKDGNIDFASNIWYVAGFDFRQLSRLLFKKIGG